jgi:SAM-dependent methyltransferase
MQKAEFDKFADEYHAQHSKNISVSGESPEFFAEYKIADVAEHCAASALLPKRILDFGAGIGNAVPYFRKYFSSASLTCVDVSEKSLAIGAERFPNGAEFVPFDGQKLPFPDQSFEVAFAACVFHHIEHEKHLGLLKELRRVTTHGGLLAIFEHNPYNPLTVRAVNTCEFDTNARLIKAADFSAAVRAAGFSKIAVKYRIFFPGFLRQLRPLEQFLGWVPLGAQYCVYGC